METLQQEMDRAFDPPEDEEDAENGQQQGGGSIVLEADKLKDEGKAFLNFWEWMCTNGFEPHPALRMRINPTTGRGIVVSKLVKEGETLFKIPNGLLLDEFTTGLSKDIAEWDWKDQDEETTEQREAKDLHLINDGSEDIMDQDEGNTDDDGEQKGSHDRLIAAMIYEVCLGSQSFFKPYLDVLPRDLDVPMRWSKVEQDKLLKGTPIYNALDQSSLRQHHEEEFLPFVRANLNKIKPNPANFEDPSGVPNPESFELYEWCGLIIAAYAFSGEREIDEAHSDGQNGNNDDRNTRLITSLVPMADMLNHRTGYCNSNLEGAGENGTTSSMKAVRPILPHYECFNTYGNIGNAELLFKYGFVDYPNVFSTTTLDWRWAVQRSEEEHTKTARTEQWRLKSSILRRWSAYLGRSEQGLMDVEYMARSVTQSDIERNGLPKFKTPPSLRFIAAIHCLNESQAREFLEEIMPQCEYRTGMVELISAEKPLDLDWCAKQGWTDHKGEALTLGNEAQYRAMLEDQSGDADVATLPDDWNWAAVNGPDGDTHPLLFCAWRGMLHAKNDALRAMAFCENVVRSWRDHLRSEVFVGGRLDFDVDSETTVPETIAPETVEEAKQRAALWRKTDDELEQDQCHPLNVAISSTDMDVRWQEALWWWRSYRRAEESSMADAQNTATPPNPHRLNRFEWDVLHCAINRSRESKARFLCWEQVRMLTELEEQYATIREEVLEAQRAASLKRSNENRAAERAKATKSARDKKREKHLKKRQKRA
eukprot:Clim_evm5s68 gene=Clim_evmTU5s68